MDYTSLARVKAEIHGKATGDDALLSLLITAASRAFDRKCTGVPDAVDYFKLEAITGESLVGQIDNEGKVICYPHKPIVLTCSSFSYRINPVSDSDVVDAARVWCDGPKVTAYPATYPSGYPYLRGPAFPYSWGSQPSKCQVTISYTGGLGNCVSDADAMVTPLSCATGGAYVAPTLTTGLPPDLVELVTLLAARYYREAEGSLSDVIGVAELSTLVYTKAWPIRLVEQMQPFMRKVGWRHVN